MRTIYLIRHGEIEKPYAHMYVGLTDLPLNQKGRIQADKTGQWIKENGNVSAVYTSPLIRCRCTAERIASCCKNAPLRIEDGLKEVNLGIWDGHSIQEIHQKYPEAYARRGECIIDYQITGGESLREAVQRFARTIHKILQESNGNLAIVSHAGVERGWLSTWMGEPLENMFQVKMEYGAIAILEEENQTIRIRKMPFNPE